MQNDHIAQVNHERLLPEDGQQQPSRSCSRRLTTTAAAASEAGQKADFALVFLPQNKIKDRHSRPLAPPLPSASSTRLHPGQAQRLPTQRQTPVAPPRPEHTLTPESRPVRPQKPQKIMSPVSSNVEAATPVMELVSLPAANLNNLKKVSLTSPRPEPEREKNLYTEAPKKVLLQPLAASEAASAAAALPQKSHISSTVIKPSQKEVSKTTTEDSGLLMETIFCQDCGKCKCQACVRPRKLPQKWLCGGTCLASQRTVVDSLSCMCCVKGILYHCTKDQVDDGEPAEVNPCTTSRGWLAMALLWPVLPCLLAYPALNMCAKMTEAVYAKCTASGCQCQKAPQASSSLEATITDSPSSSNSLTKVMSNSSLSHTVKDSQINLKHQQLPLINNNSNSVQAPINPSMPKIIKGPHQPQHQQQPPASRRS